MMNYQITTSAALANDFNAPQVFSFANTVELRNFLAEAPRTGWVYDDDTCAMIPAAVYFRITDLNDRTDISAQVAERGWIDSAEIG